MGYLEENIPDNSFAVVCQDLYKFRIIVNPGFASDRELRLIVRDVVPDVEEWQFSGRRRRCPRTDNKIVHSVFPRSYAFNSRKIRQFEERVVFAFHTELQRSNVASRLTNEGFKFELEDEPTPLTQPVILVVP